MYLALDIETTGLDPAHDHILEVAWAFLDDKLERLTETKSALITPQAGMWSQLACNPFVRKMHADSGLSDQLADHPELTHHLDDVFMQIGEERLALVGDDDKLILLGNSPAGVDRPFINQQVPWFGRLLSYRMLDVTSLWMVAQAADLPDIKDDDVAHRAAADIDWSIWAVQTYRNEFKS